MPYQITITKQSEVRMITRGEHTVIAERPWTSDELNNKRYYNGEEEFLKCNPTTKVYGYAPDREVSKVIEVEMLKQTVESLDLSAVIKAINKL